MTRLTVHEYAAALRARYRATRKGAKERILDEFCQTTGMHRRAAIRLLAKPTCLAPVRRGRPRRYGREWLSGRPPSTPVRWSLPAADGPCVRRGHLTMKTCLRGLVLGALGVLAATLFAGGGGDASAWQTTAGLPRILVDSSRDGGGWWFPQGAGFD